LVARSALRIGTERSALPVGTDQPVLRDAAGRPFIPGSSLKGALRSYLEAWVRGTLPPDLQDEDLRRFACDPTGDAAQAWCVTTDRMAALREAEGTAADITEAVCEESCLLCLTFGSAWLASHVRVPDLPVVPETWLGQFEVRDGVAIDRDKGTAADGRLYDYEVVPAGTAFVFELVGENLADWQRGLVWMGIVALTRGAIALGGYTRRGLGWVELAEDYALTGAGEADLMALLAGRGGGDAVTPAMTRAWVQALRARMEVMDVYTEAV
jgi:CRISPR-associated RAMP protein (TIGR02581 family)